MTVYGPDLFICSMSFHKIDEPQWVARLIRTVSQLCSTQGRCYEFWAPLNGKHIWDPVSQLLIGQTWMSLSQLYRLPPHGGPLISDFATPLPPWALGIILNPPATPSMAPLEVQPQKTHLQWRCTWCESRDPPAPRRCWTWSTWTVPWMSPIRGSSRRRSDRWAARIQRARRGFRCDQSGTRTTAPCSNSYQKPAGSFVWGVLWQTKEWWEKRKTTV